MLASFSHTWRPSSDHTVTKRPQIIQAILVIETAVQSQQRLSDLPTVGRASRAVPARCALHDNHQVDLACEQSRSCYDEVRDIDGSLTGCICRPSPPRFRDEAQKAAFGGKRVLLPTLVLLLLTSTTFIFYQLQKHTPSPERRVMLCFSLQGLYLAAVTGRGWSHLQRLLTRSGMRFCLFCTGGGLLQ